jgi:hypothetical protein
MGTFYKIKNFMLITFMMLSTFFVYAQTSTTSGSWTTGSTWVGGSSPTLTGGAGNLNSDVTIEVGHTVTLSSNLTIKSGVTLTVKGTLIISSGGDVDFQNGSIIVVQSGGTLEMNGLTNSNNSTNVTIHGNLIVNGNYDAGAGSELSGNGDMTVSGTSSGTGTTFGTTLSCSDCTIDGTGTIENDIIDGSSYGQHAPIEPYWNWTYSQQIYYQSEIDQEGNITRLAFEYNGNASYTDQVEPIICVSFPVNIDIIYKIVVVIPTPIITNKAILTIVFISSYCVFFCSTSKSYSIDSLDFCTSIKDSLSSSFILSISSLAFCNSLFWSCTFLVISNLFRLVSLSLSEQITKYLENSSSLSDLITLRILPSKHIPFSLYILSNTSLVSSLTFTIIYIP